MKKIYSVSALALSLCASGAIAAVSFSGLDMATVKANIKQVNNKDNVVEFSNHPSIEQLRAFAAAQTRAEENGDTELPKGVIVEKLIDKNFDNWTEGSLEDPDSINVANDSTLVDKLMGVESGWTLFQTYQAGGNMYLGMDEVGDNGPGYFMTPGHDLTDPKVAFRYRVTAMNVNNNNQEQGLQSFFMYENPSTGKGQIFLASAVPMKYNEWTECVWTGKVSEKSYDNIRAMSLGWQGKVMIKNVVLEKLTYPVASVSKVSLSYNPGKLTATWDAPEGASEYKATLHVVTEEDDIEIGSMTVTEPSATFETTLYEDAVRYYVSVVAYNAAGEESYPMSGYAELKPTEVGNAVALPATNISDKGFTANWEAITDAARTMVFPVQNHKATGKEQYVLLNEDFSNVPLANDSNNPSLICPLMGKENMDGMMSVAGWSTDLCFFMRMLPEIPCIILTNLYAAYGLQGYLLSPAYDLSVGGGNVFISGMALSAADDAVLTFYLVDADTMQPYASKEVEVNTDGVLLDVTIEGGKPNSRIMFMMTDCAEEEMIAIPALAMSVDLNDGEEITAPLPTEFVEAPATSYDFKYPVDTNNSYSYKVQGIFKEIFGEVSESVEVVAGETDGVATAVAGNGIATLNGGVLNVANPDGEKVTVVTVDGKVLAITCDSELTLNVESGSVIVRIGDKTFKFVR